MGMHRNWKSIEMTACMAHVQQCNATNLFNAKYWLRSRNKMGLDASDHGGPYTSFQRTEGFKLYHTWPLYSLWKENEILLTC